MARGPAQDYDQLYAHAWSSMVRLAFLLLGDLPSAEDVVQDAFVNVYRRWAKIDDPAAARAYLRVAVVNGARSVGRRRAAAGRALVRHIGTEPALHDATAPPPAEPDDAVLIALHELTRRQQEVLVLRYWADLSEAEIAATLHISPGTVKSTAARALHALHTRLEAPDAQR